jgi:hypothetical protein
MLRAYSIVGIEGSRYGSYPATESTECFGKLGEVGERDTTVPNGLPHGSLPYEDSLRGERLLLYYSITDITRSGRRLALNVVAGQMQLRSIEFFWALHSNFLQNSQYRTGK